MAAHENPGPARDDDLNVVRTPPRRYKPGRRSPGASRGRMPPARRAGGPRSGPVSQGRSQPPSASSLVHQQGGEAPDEHAAHAERRADEPDGCRTRSRLAGIDQLGERDPERRGHLGRSAATPPAPGVCHQASTGVTVKPLRADVQLAAGPPAPPPRPGRRPASSAASRSAAATGPSSPASTAPPGNAGWPGGAAATGSAGRAAGRGRRARLAEEHEHRGGRPPSRAAAAAAAVAPSSVGASPASGAASGGRRRPSRGHGGHENGPGLHQRARHLRVGRAEAVGRAQPGHRAGAAGRVGGRGRRRRPCQISRCDSIVQSGAGTARPRPARP